MITPALVALNIDVRTKWKLGAMCVMALANCKKKKEIKNKKTEEPLAHLHKLKQTRAYNQIETRH